MIHTANPQSIQGYIYYIYIIFSFLYRLSKSFRDDRCGSGGSSSGSSGHGTLRRHDDVHVAGQEADHGDENREPGGLGLGVGERGLVQVSLKSGEEGCPSENPEIKIKKTD